MSAPSASGLLVLCELLRVTDVGTLTFLPFYPLIGTLMKHLTLVRGKTILVPRRSLLVLCPREVWERAGESFRRVSLGDVTAHGRVQD